MMEHPGGCHCGNIQVRLRLSKAPEDSPLRACTCSFCQSHTPRMLRSRRAIRALGRGLVAGRELPVRHPQLRLRDLPPLRRLHRRRVGDGRRRSGRGQRQLPRRPRALHGTADASRVPRRDARDAAVAPRRQLDARHPPAIGADRPLSRRREKLLRARSRVDDDHHGKDHADCHDRDGEERRRDHRRDHRDIRQPRQQGGGRQHAEADGRAHDHGGENTAERDEVSPETAKAHAMKSSCAEREFPCERRPMEKIKATTGPENSVGARTSPLPTAFEPFQPLMALPAATQHGPRGTGSTLLRCVCCRLRGARAAEKRWLILRL